MAHTASTKAATGDQAGRGAGNYQHYLLFFSCASYMNYNNKTWKHTKKANNKSKPQSQKPLRIKSCARVRGGNKIIKITKGKRDRLRRKTTTYEKCVQEKSS